MAIIRRLCLGGTLADGVDAVPVKEIGGSYLVDSVVQLRGESEITDEAVDSYHRLLAERMASHPDFGPRLLDLYRDVECVAGDSVEVRAALDRLVPAAICLGADAAFAMG